MQANLIADGALDFLGGQDASKIPDRVPENAFYAGVNVSTRRASLQPRWGFERITITYPEGYVLDKYKRLRSYKEIFEAGKFQAFAPYRFGGADYLLIVISGVIFLFDIDTQALSVVPISDGSMLNSRAPRINWSDAGDKTVIYDYPAYPVILEGFTARRANPWVYEIPIAVMGTYNQNRLVIANNGSEWTAGDPVGNTLTPDAPITFEEIVLPASPYLGQIFQLPTGFTYDEITAMGFLQTVDTATGIGPLLVASDRAVFSYRTDIPRWDWEAGAFGSVVVYNAGIVGPRAMANVNSDTFFISKDKHVRSLSMSRNEQSRWSKVPISREVENWLVVNDPALLKYSFVGYFKNKVFFSVNPYRMQAVDFDTRLAISDYAFGGMVVLELDNVTSFGEAGKPAWIGLWTGIHPMDMVSIGERAFTISKDLTRINRISEINPEINYDTADGKIRYVKSRIYTREMDFKDPFMNKECHSIDLNMDALKGDFKVGIKYKPSHCPYFLDWRVFEHKAPWRCCLTPGDSVINGYAHHMIRDLTLGSPENQDCDPVTSEYYRCFKKVQLMLDFEGIYWELHEFRVKASIRPQADTATICESFPMVCLAEECINDWLVEDFESCQAKVT